jgi:hypothetical protein
MQVAWAAVAASPASRNTADRITILIGRFLDAVKGPASGRSEV